MSSFMTSFDIRKIIKFAKFMTAERLNSVTVLHINKELTTTVDIKGIMKDFIEANDTRRAHVWRSV